MFDPDMEKVATVGGYGILTTIVALFLRSAVLRTWIRDRVNTAYGKAEVDLLQRLQDRAKAAEDRADAATAALNEMVGKFAAIHRELEVVREENGRLLVSIDDLQRRIAAALGEKR